MRSQRRWERRKIRKRYDNCMKKERAFVHEVHSWIRESKYKGVLENSPSFALHIVSVLLEEAMIIRGIDIWNVRKLSKNFHRFPEILKNFLRTFVDTHLLWSVAGLSDLNFVVAAGAGWDEFSKTKKRKASDAKVCRSCRFWKMLKTDDFVPKIGVDTAENELRKEWRVVKTLWLSAEQARRKETKGTAELIRFL